MPGIAGIIGPGGGETHRRALKPMLQALTRETAASAGQLSEPSLGLELGWISPAGSFADCLPIWNEAGDIGMVFFGEEFSERSDLEQLRSRGHAFAENNASYLVHLYEEFGLKFLERLNGWFSGLLIDKREAKAILFNDRYGLGQIYWHARGDAFYFSSEAKSLLKALPDLRRFDPASLGEFISCGCVLQGRTLFAEISLLPTGSAWTFDRQGRSAKKFYFRQELWENQPALSPAEFESRLQATWERLLPRYLRAGERAGLSLTGGVDSRMILAWAGKLGRDLPCYTFAGRYRECADIQIARAAAQICRRPYGTIPLGQEFLADFPALAAKTIEISDGRMDVTGCVDLYVQAKIRSIAPIRVTGTNGGEILRRLVAFKPMPLGRSVFDAGVLEQMDRAAVTYAEELRGHKLSFTAFKQAPWYMNSKFVLERAQLTLRLPYFDNELVALSYQAPPELATSNQPALRLIAAGDAALQNLETDRGVVLSAWPGLGQARHWFQQFTFKAEYAYDYGMPQWLARLDHLVAFCHLENLFLGRHKFHHFRVWYRDELSGFLRETLLDARSLGRSHLRRSVLEEMVRGHTGGYRNHTLEFHKLLTLELIQRQLLEQN